jgi:MutS domain V
MPNLTHDLFHHLVFRVDYRPGSGKSTYLKQIAIITILAHCGSYVTAESAKIPIRDRVCCRIGNADDQEHNISTFMLEMKETAFICNNATESSLVLVDELGRATSNEDGVAIAWSMSEYLLKKRAMTFFVTHYPQLSSLASIYPIVQNMHMEASVTRGNHGEISYTHKGKPGACTVSTDYGVELAASCGWPAEVVEKARVIQDQVEESLPDESLCHLDHVSDSRTKAYEVLGAVGQELQGLITDERAQSFASIRSDLSDMQERHVPHANTELISAMDQLIFRESRAQRGWGRRQQDGVQSVSVMGHEAVDAQPKITSFGNSTHQRVTAETEADSDSESNDEGSDLSSSSSGSSDDDSSANLDADDE